MKDLFASHCENATACQDEIVRCFARFLAGEPVRVDGGPPMCGFAKHRMSAKPLQIGKYSWLWSERTGKYSGCAFWSTAAAEDYRELARDNPATTPHGLDLLAQRITRGLLQLQHEHVFPRQDLKRRVNPTLGQARSHEEAWDLLDRYCQGCVVTREEHLRLPAHGHPSNPWMRYRGLGIRLVDNPAWSERHRGWITEAALV